MLEGENLFTLQTEINGLLEISDSPSIIKIVNHSPLANISFTQVGTVITLSTANSTDPDKQQLSYLWSEDSTNPEMLGINGQT